MLTAFKSVTLELLENPELQAIALGGGAIGSPRVRAALAAARVVWLDVDSDQAWARARASERTAIFKSRRNDMPLLQLDGILVRPWHGLPIGQLDDLC